MALLQAGYSQKCWHKLSVRHLPLAGLDCIQTFQVDLVRSCKDGSDGSRPQPSIGAAVQGPAIPADKALLE